MNDRFKFRTWDKDNEEYTTDSHIILSSDGVVRYIEDSNWYEDVSEYCDVEFCTGVKDKNGELIYEGDIVALDEYGVYAVIEWDSQSGHWNIITNENTIYTFDNLYGYELIVEGDIHNDSILLGENDETN